MLQPLLTSVFFPQHFSVPTFRFGNVSVFQLAFVASFVATWYAEQHGQHHGYLHRPKRRRRSLKTVGKGLKLLRVNFTYFKFEIKGERQISNQQRFYGDRATTRGRRQAFGTESERLLLIPCFDIV